ncbi:BCCT family transporter [Bacillus taeanensis]|uniref:BCCT family transporter n=1 Tax=Bacillus taeanensis TaxID=273032 RepID=A0A366Y2X8_9BACI|nr:BCCT family transporter [Bacillus taeanensis]RBW70744.1 BCCT family transporter [Bacillus taeanensis]
MFKNNSVFISSVSLTFIFIILGIFFTDLLSKVFSASLTFILSYFGWFIILGSFFFLAFCVYLAFSKFGAIRLGDDNDKPSYSTGSWLAMLFSAGIGVGLIFYGVAEPVMHFVNPPLGQETSAPADIAMKYTFLHWGLGAWALFGFVALCVAYFQFRKKLPGLISSTFYPILGEKIYGPIGKSIDSYSAFMTALNTSVVLGMTALQVTSGLHFLWGIPNTLTTQILTIGIATVLFLISASTGLDRGIKYLSNLNFTLFFLLMALVLLIGPTIKILNIFINTTGIYLADLIPMSLHLGTFNKDETGWIESWTIFYWAWWVAWTPFVGGFIARISKGRTIKEFVIGVFIVPSVLSFLWFSIFGGGALHMIQELNYTGLADTVSQDVTLAMYAFLDYLPGGAFLSIIAALLLITFFVTSADSATFTLSVYCTNGVLNPSNKIKLIWGVLIAIGAVALLISGGLSTVQSVAIVTTFPFFFFMVLMNVAIVKDLKGEVKKQVVNDMKTSVESNINMHKKAK